MIWFLVAAALFALALVAFFGIIFIMIEVIGVILYKINPKSHHICNISDNSYGRISNFHSPDIVETLDENASREYTHLEALNAQARIDLHNEMPNIHINDGHIDNTLHNMGGLGNLFLNG